MLYSAVWHLFVSAFWNEDVPYEGMQTLQSHSASVPPAVYALVRSRIPLKIVMFV
jgi:hypothetical protein